MTRPRMTVHPRSALGLAVRRHRQRSMGVLRTCALPGCPREFASDTAAIILSGAHAYCSGTCFERSRTPIRPEST